MVPPACSDRLPGPVFLPQPLHARLGSRRGTTADRRRQERQGTTRAGQRSPDGGRSPSGHPIWQQISQPDVRRATPTRWDRPRARPQPRLHRRRRARLHDRRIESHRNPLVAAPICKPAAASPSPTSPTTSPAPAISPTASPSCTRAPSSKPVPSAPSSITRFIPTPSPSSPPSPNRIQPIVIDGARSFPANRHPSPMPPPIAPFLPLPTPHARHLRRRPPRPRRIDATIRSPASLLLGDSRALNPDPILVEGVFALSCPKLSAAC